MVPVTITARITSTWRSVIMSWHPKDNRDRDYLMRAMMSASGKGGVVARSVAAASAAATAS
jgi:hypothetical protein